MQVPSQPQTCPVLYSAAPMTQPAFLKDPSIACCKEGWRAHLGIWGHTKCSQQNKLHSQCKGPFLIFHGPRGKEKEKMVQNSGAKNASKIESALGRAIRTFPKIFNPPWCTNSHQPRLPGCITGDTCLHQRLINSIDIWIVEGGRLLAEEVGFL